MVYKVQNTKNPFDNWAKNYESDILKLQNEYPFAGYFEIVESIRKTLDNYSKPKVLDLGIGSGFMISKLKSKVDFDCIGLDASPKMLDLATFVVGDENTILWDITQENIPKSIDNQQFDVVISAFTLHHFDNNQKLEIINKYQSLLQPSGIFIIADICFDNEAALQKVKLEAGEHWDKSEESGYIRVNHFLEKVSRYYQANYEKISFCTGVFCLKKLVV